MPSIVPAVIYARVSSAKQKREGDGLRGQEKSSRDYADAHGYPVIAVFDDDISGGMVSRAGFDAMLAFLDERHAQGLETVVVIDDIKRLARDVISHYTLKVEVYRRGGRLESPLFQFEDTPEGKFRETIFAAQAELERTQNARQVRRRTRARMEQGLWAFSAIPPGYRYVRHPVFKKLLDPDPANADMVREALEGFASTRFGSVAEVTQFLASRGFFTPNLRGVSREKTVRRMLRHILYTGHVEYAPWGITLRKGQHAALISLACYDRIQEKLDRRTLPTQRKDTTADFPLRNFLTCGHCGHGLTASWSRGRTKSYGYYHCFNPACREHGRTTPKEQVEADFLDLLRRYETTDEVLALTERFVVERWEADQDVRRASLETLFKRQQEIDRDIARLSERLGMVESETVFKQLELQVEKLVSERRRLDETATYTGTLRGDVGTAFRQLRPLLRSPYESWISADVSRRRTITRLVFPSGLPYVRRRGFRTADSALPYRVLREVQQAEQSLVGSTSETSEALQVPNLLRDPATYDELIATLQEWARLVNPV